MFEVLIENSVSEKLNLFPSKQTERFKERLRALKKNPFPNPGSDIQEIKGSKRSAYRLRIGDYRFFYIIDSKAKIVKVTEFLTAEEAHKKYGRI